MIFRELVKQQWHMHLQMHSDLSTTEYSFLWSFGDGSYSTEHYPEYTYADVADLTEYQVVLYATPIYTPIGPPPAALLVSDFISIGSGSSVSPRPYMEDVNLQLSYNRAPRGSYESTFILTYRNIAPTAQTFDVHFDFNDAHLEYLDIIAPGGEILDQQTTLPFKSVTVTIVLLNVA